MFLPDYAVNVIEEMHKSGYNIHPVGGCVRNFLMGLTPDDYDMTTDATPQETIKVFEGYNLFTAGLKHGTVSVVVGKEVVEITTYRIETTYSDNRHPDEVIFTKDIDDDLRRRDFTMNAIAYDYYSDSFHDPYGGIDDINNRIIRAVGNPEKRFNEDGLRILRALRFASVLDFDIEENTSKAIHSCKYLLDGISVERIYTEFTKLLCGKNVRKILSDYYDVIAVFIPEILPCVGFDQQNIHHCYDVYEHTLATVEAVDPDPILRWTMLCHDLGKPETFFADERGGHFFGHYKSSSLMAKAVLSRLHASNDMIDTVSMLVYHHDSVIPETEKSVRRMLMRFGVDNTKRIFKVNRADAMGQAHYQLDERLARIDRLEAIADNVIEGNQCFSMKDMNINGYDLIDLGINGKQIGDVLNALLSEVIDGDISNEKEALIKRAIELK